MLKSLRSYLGRRLRRRAAATLPPHKYGVPAFLKPITCSLTPEYVAALRHAADRGCPDADAPDHEKAADLVRWGYLGHDEHREYRLTESGRKALQRDAASGDADPASAERAVQA